MPQTPSKSLVTTARGAGMTHQDGLNNSQSYNSQGYNTFDRSSLRLLTSRFADIVPYDCQIPVDGDVIRKRNAFDISTYTMQSRMLTDVKVSTDAFFVPLSAIMPNTWRLIVKNPIKGNDIPNNVYPYWNFSEFIWAVRDFIGDLSSSTPLDHFRFIIAFNGILGHYGLLKHLGVSTPFADIADDLYANMVSELNSFSYLLTFKDRDGRSYQFGTGVSLSALCGLLDRYWKGEIEITSIGSFVPDVTYAPPGGSSLSTVITAFSQLDSSAVRTIDMRPVFAYQMACAQFYSNSHIDDIYTGDMYLQNLAAFSSPQSFTLNGVHYFYDFASSYQLYFSLIEPLVNFDISTWFIFASNIFALRSSLREPDYFVNSRLTQLAVGDFNISVNQNKVSVIDVNEREWYQRFANAVNRSPGEINQYLFNMFGVQRERIEPQPSFVVHEEFDLGQSQTENTGSAQVSDADSVTTRMGQALSRYMYEIFIDEPEGVVLSLFSTTAKYVYDKAIDKIYDTQNRFDMFQTLLQHVGDQEVKTHELDCNTPYDQNLGFQLRYAQYKNAISHCTGGFSRGVLPSWALIWPSAEITPSPVLSERIVLNSLTPEFIRNHNDDFDKFYTSLTGMCPSERFHFIVKVFNAVVNNSRQQAYPTLM